MKIKFLLFADFHYKKPMYASTVTDLTQIIWRAAANNAECMVHLGDFSNDYKGSPELFSVLYSNPFAIPCYGVYGNHELETVGNTMQVVTPKLLSAPDNVIFGTADGKIGDGSVAYYHFDRGDFRFIFTDTNYSLSPAGEWEHNKEGSWGPPKDNAHANSLGPAQLAWLEKTVTDCAEKGKTALVFGHAGFSPRYPHSDAEAVRAIFARANALRPKTVLMVCNGHYHTNHADVADGILYLDVNTVRNTYWKPTNEYHYAPTDTYYRPDYAADGTPLGIHEVAYNDLWQSKNTWFTHDPLSAVVTVDTDGEITIDGTKSSWVADIAPETDEDGVMPEISNWHFAL